MEQLVTFTCKQCNRHASIWVSLASHVDWESRQICNPHAAHRGPADTVPSRQGLVPGNRSRDPACGSGRVPTPQLTSSGGRLTPRSHLRFSLHDRPPPRWLWAGSGRGPRAESAAVPDAPSVLPPGRRRVSSPAGTSPLPVSWRVASCARIWPLVSLTSRLSGFYSFVCVTTGFSWSRGCFIFL